MELPVSEHDVWTFKRDRNGAWIWVRYSPDGEPLSASWADYEELEDCIADARSRGYVEPQPEHP